MIRHTYKIKLFLVILFLSLVFVSSLFIIFFNNNNRINIACKGVRLSASLNEPYPDYVLKTFPSPKSTIKFTEYTIESGISIKLDAHEIYKLTEGEDYSSRLFNSKNLFMPSTSKLFLNSQSISNNGMKVYQLDEITEVNASSNQVVYKGARQVELFWKKHLPPGDFEASFYIRNNFGCLIFNYTWDFVIVDG